MKTRIVIGLSLFLFLFQSCGKGCKGYAEDERPKKYFFKVYKKFRENRYRILEGIGRNDKVQEFKFGGFEDLYSAVDIGDSLIKNQGELIYTVIKKDTTLTFYIECDGLIIE